MTSLALTFISPTNVEESLLHPSSFQHPSSRYVSMFFHPIFFCLLAKQGQSRLQPNTLLKFFILVLCCPLLPVDCSGLLQQRFLHIFLANVSHVDTQITGLAHHCSCRSSYLPPQLNFLNLLHPHLSLFVVPLSRPDSFCPVLSGHGGKLFLYFNAICFHAE